MSSIFREVVGAICCCCLPDEPASDKAGLSRDLKRLSDWRAHPTLRQYDLEKHIADGGFAEVWLVRNRSTGEEQCLKVVNLRKPGLLPEDAEVLRGEARFLRLLEHPGLLRCRDVFETKYHMVMVLEYLSGGQMLDHLHLVDHYSEGQAARLFAQVASAVAYMHNLNIVHRDIKPENVMFARPVEACVAAGRPLRVKLIDLGMAAVLVPPGEASEEEAEAAPRARKRRRRTAGGHKAAAAARRDPPRGCLGSPGFIAPEVVHGAVHTVVYALGVLLFAMLTGRKPWSLRDSRNLAYAEKSIRDAPGLKDLIFLSLSSAARELLLAMLADDPRVRPTCAEVLRHPFIKQSLAAAAGGGGGSGSVLQPPLDGAIKRRFAQLASLRRFRGLAFAMMSSRQQQQQGQELAEFTKQLTERRRELHRDLIIRAKTRQSLEMQREWLSQQQQQQQASGKGPLAVAGASSAIAAGSPLEGRPSIDSACSQQPLLPALHHHHNHQYLTTTCSTNDSDASNHTCNQRNQPPSHRHANRPSQPQLQQHRPTHRLQIESSRRSFDSLASSASSRQPLVGCGGGGGPPLPSDHLSHPALWLAASGGFPGAAAAAASPAGPEDYDIGGGGGGGAAGGLPAAGFHRTRGAPQPHHRISNSHQVYHHVLDPVAEPGEGASTLPGATAAAAAAAAAAPPPLPPAAGAAGAGRGWSSSGRRPPPSAAAAAAATPPPPQRRLATRPLRPPVRQMELELAAVDPLAVLRELPAAAGGGRLGRAHSAPESLAASLLVFGSGGGRRDGGGGGGGGHARAGGGGGGARAGGRGSGLDVWADRIALGADMRAASANSWTLDLLENADLLMALTGIALYRQASSTTTLATLEPSVHGGGGYGIGIGGGTPSSYGGPLATAPSAGASAAAAAMLQRLQSDAARSHTPATARDGSSHRQLAYTLLAAARARTSSHGSAAAAAASGGRRSSAFTSAAAAAAAAAIAAVAESPTRPSGLVAAVPDTGILSPTSALSQSQVALDPVSGSVGHGTQRGAQPRALFLAGCPAPPMRPSLDGRAPLLLVPPGSLSPMLGDGCRSGAAAVTAAPAAAGAGPDEPMPLLRSARYDGGDAAGGGGGGLAGLTAAPAFDVSYTYLHLSDASRHCGLALPTASMSLAAAAAQVAAAATESAAGLAPPVAAAAAPEPAFVRRPTNLALLDMEEQVEARRASLEESFHNGNIWARMGSGAGLRSSLGGGAAAAAAGSPAAALAVAAAAAAGISGDLSNHHRSAGTPRGSFIACPGGAGASPTSAGAGAISAPRPQLSGQPQELRLPGCSASVSSVSAVAAPSPPALARITECSDLGADGAPGGAEEWPSARALGTFAAVAAAAAPAGGAGGAPAAPPHAGPSSAAGARPPETRWRSPFEPLAMAPMSPEWA
ncbi:hypothetical protein PLESTF_000409600 [Pleodorina starrii]|nr:hypothetical protein PLESTM_001451100 [Pleodorina starrii]GLC66304.1 hypothetical protein PLESTF_000409600 [Pleodorina starrii]